MAWIYKTIKIAGQDVSMKSFNGRTWVMAARSEGGVATNEKMPKPVEWVSKPDRNIVRNPPVHCATQKILVVIKGRIVQFGGKMRTHRPPPPPAASAMKMHLENDKARRMAAYMRALALLDTAAPYDPMGVREPGSRQRQEGIGTRYLPVRRENDSVYGKPAPEVTAARGLAKIKKIVEG